MRRRTRRSTSSSPPSHRSSSGAPRACRGGFPNVNGMTRIALAAAAVVALAVGGLFVLNRGPSDPGGPTTPTPHPRAERRAHPPAIDLLDVSTWTAFTLVPLWLQREVSGNATDPSRQRPSGGCPTPRATCSTASKAMAPSSGSTASRRCSPWAQRRMTGMRVSTGPRRGRQSLGARNLLHGPGGLGLDDHRRPCGGPSSRLRGAGGLRFRRRPGLFLRRLRLRDAQSPDRRAGRLG